MAYRRFGDSFAGVCAIPSIRCQLPRVGRSGAGTGRVSCRHWGGVVALALFACLLHVFSRGIPFDFRKAVLAFALAICTVLGRSLNLYGDLSFVKSDAIHLALSLFFLVGYSCLFYLFFELVFYFIERISRLGNDSQTSFAKVFGIRFAVILACYLPYMIVMFPGHTSSDFIGELRQFYGAIPAGNHHPWFMTMLFGALFQAGSFVVGSSQGGVFLVSFVQTVAMASTFAFFVALLSKAGCPRAVGLGLTAFFALCPIFPIYAQW